MSEELKQIISDIESEIIRERNEISFDVGEKEKLVNSGVHDGLALALDIIDKRVKGEE